jgi:general secretion pathway protein B
MSFILDALKKSEAERSRNSGPILLELRQAQPRPRLPWWAVVIGVALVANLGVLGYALLRPDPPPAATEPVMAPAAAPAAQAPAAQSPAPVAVVPSAAVVQALPPVVAADPGAGGVLPDPALAQTPLPAMDPDDLPAIAPRQMPPPATNAPRPAAGSELGLPTMADLVGAGVRLPDLRLALHAYDPVPASRYVLLNSTRLREGEVTPEGLRVEQITETGVVLDFRGRRFMLRPGE